MEKMCEFLFQIFLVWVLWKVIKALSEMKGERYRSESRVVDVFTVSNSRMSSLDLFTTFPEKQYLAIALQNLNESSVTEIVNAVLTDEQGDTIHCCDGVFAGTLNDDNEWTFSKYQSSNALPLTSQDAASIFLFKYDDVKHMITHVDYFGRTVEKFQDHCKFRIHLSDHSRAVMVPIKNLWNVVEE